MEEKNKAILMSHLVAGYPNDELALVVARALIAGGTSILEIQLPFSDPSADGPAIQEACTKVLARGYRTKDAFNLVKQIRNEFPKITIYIMSYASLVYTPGIYAFCQNASNAGANGLIVPDLPFDFDEGLSEACKAQGMVNIPVAAPSMSKERLQTLCNAHYPYLYAALRTGITGSNTTIDKKTLGFLDALRASKSKIYGGFGISCKEQVESLCGTVDGVVAGSVFVRIIAEYAKLIQENKACKEDLFCAIRNKAREFSLS